MQKDYIKEEYPRSAITSQIIPAVKEVHHILRPVYEEVIYQRALVLELPAHGLDFEREVWIDVPYKGEKIGKKRVDFMIDEVLLEIKATTAFEYVDVVQTLSYLKASGLEVALLLNFGAKALGVKRLIHAPKDQ